MNPDQVQRLLLPGAVFQVTASDRRAGPETWAGLRVQDGLLVCMEPVPEGIADDKVLDAWLKSAPRRWLFVADDQIAWCFVDWWLGHGATAAVSDEESRAIIEQDDDMLLLASVACRLAKVLFPAWSSYNTTGSLEVEVVAVYPVIET